MKGEKSVFQQLERFAVVGGTAFLIDYGIMILLTEVFHINYLMSSCISFCISVIYNYVLSVCWVFNVDEEKGHVEKFAAFMILSVIGLGINQIVMWLSVEQLGIFYKLSKIGATAIVMIYNFVTRKLFLEKNLS